MIIIFPEISPVLGDHAGCIFFRSLMSCSPSSHNDKALLLFLQNFSFKRGKHGTGLSSLCNALALAT